MRTFSTDVRSPRQRPEQAAFCARSVTETARRRLSKFSFRELSGIRCEFHEGVLTLRGAVNSFFLRQIAFAAVRGVPGVEEVADRLEVSPKFDERS